MIDLKIWYLVFDFDFSLWFFFLVLNFWWVIDKLVLYLNQGLDIFVCMFLHFLENLI